MRRTVSSIASCLAPLVAIACTGEVSGNGSGFTPVPAEDLEEQRVDPPPEVPVQASPPPVVNSEPEVASLLQVQVENILGRSCGECHGFDGSADAGIDSIEDLDVLASEGLLIPGDADASPLLQRMSSGTMPPSGFLAPTDDEIEQVALFVNGWEGPEPELPEICSNSLITFDNLFQQMQSDLVNLDSDDRRFIRYLTIANRYNAGVCGAELDVERWAMSKMVNSLSNEPRIEAPLAIDEGATLFRIDIRDYGWDRDLSVNGQNFDDGWEAIVGTSPYAVPFEGDEADFAVFATETSVPLLYADALVDASSVGELYYALLEIPNTSNELLDDLQIDVEENRERGEAIRAGTTLSGISRSDRLVERHDIGAGRERSFWQSFDFGEGSNDSIFVDPLDFEEGESEVIYTLINGLQAYVIYDGDGNALEESAVLFDTLQDDFRVKTAVSCMTCHARGPLQVRDEVREYAETASILSFSAQEREAILELYPGEDRFDEAVVEDRDVYQRALRDAGVPTNISDPISDTFVRFNRDVTILDAAADLGVTEELLRDNIRRLDPVLGRLTALSIDRNDFSALFLESLCVMQRVSRNRPLDEVCDEFL